MSSCTNGGIILPEKKIILPDSFEFYVKPSEKEITRRRLEYYEKIAEVKQWGIENPTKFMKLFLGIELLDFQEYAFMMSWITPYVLWLESRNAGKALALTTPIPTPFGYRTMGDICVGDVVFDERKQPTRVTYISEVFVSHRCFKVEFSDGEIIIADADHLWCVRDASKLSHRYFTKNTKEIFERGGDFVIPPCGVGDGNEKHITSIIEVESVPTKCIQVDNPTKLYLCGTKDTVTHNTTMLALFSMMSGMLFDNHRIYICSGTADQSQETFKKIEDIALKNISSMRGLTDIFRQEVEISQARSNGFIHNPMGFTYRLYNGSFVRTLNSNINTQRGKRAEVVIFDEGGWLSEETFSVIGAYAAQNADFGLGGDENPTAVPKGIPHKLLYASSASSIDTAFYNRYRDYSKKMFLGDPDYFVADINCDVVINATFKGKLYPTPLLIRETVENEMRNNPEKGLREYYNQFSQDGGVGQIIKRALITRNSYTRPPVLSNSDPKRKFVLAYDPARNTDNSILAIGELKFSEKEGYCMDIVNVVSFADLGLRRKTPMMTHDQINELHNILLDYCTDSNEDYDAIEIVLADAGSGGGGNSWVRDSLILDWKDKKGAVHSGLIDKDYPNGDIYAKRYPDAVSKLRLIEPGKYKSEMYEALIKMVEADKIKFSERYDNKGYINLLEVNDELMKTSEEQIREELKELKKDMDINEFEELVEEKLSEIEAAKTIKYDLTIDEEVSLVQIDAMKDEIVNICRVKRDGGKDAFRLPAHKDADTGASEATMHDDRAYCLAMLGWYLSEKRVEKIRNKRKEAPQDVASLFPIRQGKRFSMFN